jgi:hypothetical protein
VTLEGVLDNRTPGKTRRAGHWFSYCWTDGNGEVIVNVNHHFTQMLQFKAMRPEKPYFPVPVRHVMHVDIGYGSKSDQDGMNRMFRKLGLPWYYQRGNKKNGGTPRIIEISKHPEQLPKYLQDREVRVNHFGYSA